MSAFKDLTGQRFGKLVALGVIAKRVAGTYWECVCDCGKTKPVLTSHLRLNRIRSCGCLYTTRFTDVYAVRTEKMCIKCKAVKPLSEFHVDKSRGDGLMPRCKPCQLVANRASEAKHPDRVKARSKAKWQRRYQSNRELFIQRAKDYQKTPNGKLIKRAGQARRRARERNAPGKITTSFLRELYQKQQGMCVYCSKIFNGKFHIDHIIPLSKGGTNFPENIQLLCKRCNLSKGSKMPEIFLAELSAQPMRARI